MTSREMQIAFEIEANIQDPVNLLSSTEIFYWLNRGVDKFVKTRYDGYNNKFEGFEGSQKRIDDLRTLLRESVISTSAGTNKPNSYIATLPGDYMFSVGEEADIQYTNLQSQTITSRQGVTEIVTDRYRKEIDNPLSDFTLQNDWAYPLRLFFNTYVELISDGQYTIPTFYLRYIKIPTTIDSNNNCDLPVQSHIEIVKLAVQMFIENQVGNRYQTYSAEVATME